MAISGDLLSASALALAAIAVLYSLWAPKISDSIALAKKRHLDDRCPDIKELMAVRKAKVIPLAISTLSISLVLTPPVVGVVGGVAQNFSQFGINSLRNYDPVQALFIVVWLLIAGLILINFINWFKISKKIEDFKSQE